MALDMRYKLNGCHKAPDARRAAAAHTSAPLLITCRLPPVHLLRSGECLPALWLPHCTTVSCIKPDYHFIRSAACHRCRIDGGDRDGGGGGGSGGSLFISFVGTFFI